MEVLVRHITWQYQMSTTVIFTAGHMRTYYTGILGRHINCVALSEEEQAIVGVSFWVKWFHILSRRMDRLRHLPRRVKENIWDEVIIW